MSAIISLARMKSNQNPVKRKVSFLHPAWLPNDKCDTLDLPQLSPSLILKESIYSLDSKVPLIPGLDEFVKLRTTKVGTKTIPYADFDLRIVSPNFEYKDLHDPHLKGFFSKPHIRKNLKLQGLITNDGFVKCSVQELNVYRQWVRRFKLSQQEAEARRDAEGGNEVKSRPLTEHALAVIETNKQKQILAKKNYMEKMYQEDVAKRRFMLTKARDFKAKEQAREAHNEMIRMKCKERDRQELSRRCSHRMSEEIRDLSKVQAIALKDEQFLQRKKELDDSRESARKEKKEKAMERWQLRQYHTFRMLEEKKNEADREMKRRRASIIERSKTIFKEQQKKDEKLEKAMRLSHMQSSKNVQKTNTYSQNVEQQKEAEILKWKQKQDAQKSQKCNSDLPTKAQHGLTHSSKGKQTKSASVLSAESELTIKSQELVMDALNKAVNTVSSEGEGKCGQFNAALSGPEKKMVRKVSSQGSNSSFNLEKVAKQGRRPTPIFSGTDMKRLFKDGPDGRCGMEAFGEEEEDNCVGKDENEKKRDNNKDPNSSLRQQIFKNSVSEMERKQDAYTTGANRQLSRVRPSRSRLSCAVLNSLNSYTSDVARDLECLSSGELIGSLEENESEQVMKIDMPEVDVPTDIDDKDINLVRTLKEAIGDGLENNSRTSLEGNNEDGEKVLATCSVYNSHIENTVTATDDKAQESFVVINAKEVEGVSTNHRGELENANGDKPADVSTDIDKTVWRNEELPDKVAQDRKKATKGEFFAANLVPTPKRTPSRTPSVYSMTVLNHHSEPIFRKGSLFDSNGLNRKTSAMSLPGKAFTAKVSMDKPNFDSPHEAGERHVTSRTAIGSRKSSMSPRPSLAMNTVQENDDQ